MKKKEKGNNGNWEVCPLYKQSSIIIIIIY